MLDRLRTKTGVLCTFGVPVLPVSHPFATPPSTRSHPPHPSPPLLQILRANYWLCSITHPPKFSPLPVPFPDIESGFGSLLGGRATWKRECLVLGSLNSEAWSSRCVPQLSLEEVLH